MTKYNTNNPVGSPSVKDVNDNSINFDHATNDRSAETWQDRLGGIRKTWHGMEKANEQTILAFKEESYKAILAAGYAPVGTFQGGAEINALNETVLWQLPDGDGEYYKWLGPLPKNVPENSTPLSTGGIKTEANPNGLWVSVGDASLRTDMIQGNGELLGLYYNDTQINFDANKYVQLRVFADLFIEKAPRIIDGIHAACRYVASKGGGYVDLSPRTYLLEDELIPINNVKIDGTGSGQWSGMTILKWAGGDGVGKCVVRASRAKLGEISSDALTMSGVKNCFIDAEGCDVGFYSQYATSGCDFSGLTTRNATRANAYILKSWFCDYDNLVSVLAKDKGVVIGHPLFGETGQMNVNACGFTTIKAHSSGASMITGVTDQEAGAGVILGKYMTGNYFRSVQCENNGGIGLLAHSTFTNAIGSAYIEKNAEKLGGEYKHCGLMYENGGSYSALSIASVHLAANQHIINNVDLGLVIQAIGRNDDVNSFKGTGRILLASSNLIQFTSTDFSKIASDNVELVAGKRLNTRYTASFDSMSFLLSESIGYPHVVIVPRANYSLTTNLTLRFESQPTGAVFGREFNVGEPVIRRFASLSKGFQFLRLSTPTGNSDAFFDVYVMYAKSRVGGQALPRLSV
ncbi:MAG: hypothetical protein ACTH5W_06720 [Providencia sp.]|uniref:tail fiber/spike domain-containing protein n=1 Tax=Providencia sp. TaxID=589 RepID=UPI003F957429